MSKIEVKIVADSINQQEDRLTSVLVVMPRIIIAEMNTHRMLSKNTSSSRAIPFKKMVESVQNNPFIPIAWQKAHNGMQGSEYWTEEDEVRIDIGDEFEYIEDIQPITEEFKIRWLEARDKAVNEATGMNSLGLTKQLCNRLLEPFMWTTMLITGSKEGWDNFFELRNPVYEYKGEFFRSKKDCINSYTFKQGFEDDKNYLTSLSNLQWLQINKGQAEIHMMDLAEKIYDAINESTPKKLKAGEYHIPFEDKINELYPNLTLEDKIKVSIGMAANTSYTVIGDGSIITLEKATRIHDKCKEEVHSSVFEHCCLCVSEEEYKNSYKGQEEGWFRNYKGFKSYRHLIEES